ncbi:IS1634 family transposase [Micromonospora craniellae]|uniref:IS1634 family transposase n=1 Tax=Micromonospora craniellae TaxID=2294034 RepID=A0A372FQ53_9ACTN|nr:IS1634 family transposase [Micromonospora craniellae]QOC90121.1 IS1634 family transposase [Micromonospora craniellae]QOC92164.1 IS1634 family transposase [Micromonospora craniellae]QOC92307.1 IS1634 family transposase [Micromonospora craniellae]QOC92441.1 IS1634 family transposase [Micromonospora craniellae]QOC93454.1 IS1634 family transposase [Micromonospora craniellae]
MYVKASTRKTRDGQTIRYLQLAHNEWDPAAKASKTRVLYSFGREDQLDVAGIRRLVDALSRLLAPADALAAAAPAGLSFVESRSLGGAWLLDGLWRRLRIDTVLRPLVGSSRREVDVERVLFALVANRALAPSSKLAAADWVCQDVYLPDLPHVTDDTCYRAMDQLIEVEPALTRGVYDQIADLLNLEVDLLFFDTTSTYFELDEADEPLWRDQQGRVVAEDDPAAVKQAGFRTHGKSKDSRDDLPQVVVGMAVTRTGIPVRVWCWPGNTSDSALIRQVKTDMREWSLARVVWVADRGFASAENRRFLQQGGGHYILGEKLRAGTSEADAALARQGRYATVAENLQVKEVNIDTDDRFVICYNPEAADRDAAVRQRLIAQLTDLIDDTDRLPATKRAELRGVISTKPGLNRFLRVTPKGLLRLDQAKVKAEQRLDGKYLLRCSDPTLSAEDIALGYKQLLEVERGWRDMKTTLDLRPVFHRREDRIRAHILLCWLALLLIRVAETETGRTWTAIRTEIDRLHLGVFTGPAGTFAQRTELSQPQKALLTKLKIAEPPRIFDATPATA